MKLIQYIYQSISTVNLLKYVTLGFCCFYLSIASYCQDYQRVINQSNVQSEKLEASWELFKKYRISNRDSALYFAELNNEIAKELKDTLSIVKSYNAIGYLLRENGDYIGSIKKYEVALNLSKTEGLVEQHKFMLNNLALVHTYAGNYDKALEYHFNSLELREELNDLKGMAVTYHNIGLLYYKIDDNEKALDNFQKSLNIKLENDITDGLERNYVNLGLVYTNLKEFKKARDVYKKVFNICVDNCDRKVVLEANIGAAITALTLVDYENAERYLIEAEHYAKSLESLVDLTTVYFYRSKIYYAQNNTDKAFIYLDKADSAVNQTDATIWKIEIDNLYADLYKVTGDYEKAFYYRDLASELKDSVFSEDLIKNIANLQLDYQQQQTEQIIATKDFQINQRERINLLLGGITLLVMVLVFILYKNMKLKHRANRNLANAKNIIERQNKKLTDVNAILEERVKERTKELNYANNELKKSNEELDNFIYKTSHDIRGPLATLLGVCNIARMDVEDDLALNYFEKLNLTATKLNEILSKLLIINQINNSAPQTESIKLHDLIEGLISEQKEQYKEESLSIGFLGEKGLKIVSDKELLKVIYGNLISNSFKFCDRSERVDSFVKIKLEQKNSTFVFQIVDNGIGIDQAESERIFEVFSKASDITDSTGIGLYLVKLATEKLHGNIFHGKTEEGYTFFEVTIPAILPEKEAKNKAYISL